MQISSKLLQGFALLMLLLQVHCLIGFDTAPVVTFQSTFTCLKEAGYEFSNVRAFSLAGEDLDLLTVRDSVIYSTKAGLRTEVFLRPCRGRSPKFQIDTLVLAIDDQYYQRLWIYLQENKAPGCHWGTDYKANCDFIKEMLGQVKYFNQKAGIYTDSKFYKEILGNYNCNLSEWPLIYAEADGSPNFEGYQPIGSWAAPYGKMFQTGQYACGININKIYEKVAAENLSMQ
jgi:hypothetical protein